MLLKATQYYYHTTLEVRSPKWIVKTKIKESTGLCSFWRLQNTIHFLTFSLHLQNVEASIL